MTRWAPRPVKAFKYNGAVGHEGLAFAVPISGDPALVQDEAADHLDVEVDHVPDDGLIRIP